VAGGRVAAALFPKARRAVLGLLFGHPGEAFYLRQVVGRTGLGLGSVQRELARLSGAAVLRRFARGRHVYFQADESCPVFWELRALVAGWNAPRAGRERRPGR
jgi:hypothetical protein